MIKLNQIKYEDEDLQVVVLDKEDERHKRLMSDANQQYWLIEMATDYVNEKEPEDDKYLVLTNSKSQIIGVVMVTLYLRETNTIRLEHISLFSKDPNKKRRRETKNEMRHFLIDDLINRLEPGWSIYVEANRKAKKFWEAVCERRSRKPYRNQCSFTESRTLHNMYVFRSNNQSSISVKDWLKNFDNCLGSGRAKKRMKRDS